MDYTQNEVIQYVRENDVKFIKLFFTDIFGNLRSISIQPSLLRRAFTDGISFDASAVPGFLNAARSDLFLVPDPATLTVLPWRPQHGRVARMYCAIRYPDGTAFKGDTRLILQNVMQKTEELGYDVKVGTECEFYLFKLDENGEPDFTSPHDNATYCDLAPKDKGENVRRDIILALEQMGIEPETSHHETGPGQNEIDFKYSGALKAADNLATFKNTVRTMAAQDGLFATFAPKPLHHKAGSGLHINLSLYKDGKNLFEAESPEADSFVAGILSRAREMTAFLNPWPSSYLRLGQFEAPGHVSWSRQNRSQLIRVPAAYGDTRRVELRSPDPTCNQYAALALIISAGMDGVKQNMPLSPACDLNLFDTENLSAEDRAAVEKLERLPRSLKEALEISEESDFIKSVLPEKLVQAYAAEKKAAFTFSSDILNKDNAGDICWSDLYAIEGLVRD